MNGAISSVAAPEEDWLNFPKATPAEALEQGKAIDNLIRKQEVAIAAEQEHIRRKALDVLKTGNPFEYFLNTFSLDHEGDLTAARTMALVFASSAVANGDGLHCYLSGASGRGKSHAAEIMFKQLAEEYRYNRTFSDKYLFYAAKDQKSGLREGVVLLIDDHTMSEPVQELFKVAVTKYADPEGLVYGTIMSQNPITLKMPGRINWVLLKVDEPGDDQVMNRLIQARIQETEEKIRDSAKKIQEKYRNLTNRSIKIDRIEIRVCREMWRMIKASLVTVEVPCAGHVIFTDYENLRNHELFFNLIMAHTVIFRLQRETIGQTLDHIPIIRATEADYKEAKDIFDALHLFGGQKHNTLTNEDAVITALLKMRPENGIFTIRKVAEFAGLKYQTCYRAIHGRSSGKVMEKLGGLLEKCPFIQDAGKRGTHELEIAIDRIPGRSYDSTEIVRKESYNESIYRVDIEGLSQWKNHGENVKLAPGFRWVV
jgi:hypothetical protein